ncbi:MAG TPA: ATP synthase F0 subunit B [Terriglobales bacterium]|nr:ATP synthase F0 subunit B [Terriglobales bacterium]
MTTRRLPPTTRGLLALALLAVLVGLPARSFVLAQQQPPSQSASESAKAETAKEGQQAGAEHQSARTSTETAEQEEEENVKLKHSSPVQWLATKINLSVHGAHLAAVGFNFAIVVAIVVWAGYKLVPGMLRSRSAAIQTALEEARTASQDANRRLADIENRLRRLDVEIGQMQAKAEKEAEAEEGRILKAGEEDIRKVVLAAEHEIDLAAKQARRELSTHTASLAISLARQQINVDSNTDQVLVRTFATKLASPSQKNDGGKDGR